MIKLITFNQLEVVLKRANVTVYISITLTLVLSVLFTTLESARLTVVKTHLIDTSSICMDSLFGCYCKELYEDYGIFAINPFDIDMEATLVALIDDNILPQNAFYESNFNFLTAKLNNVELEDIIYVTDNDGKYFSSQILAYMKYKELENITQTVLDNSNVIGEDIYDFNSSDSIPNMGDSNLDYSLLESDTIEDRRDCLDISDEEAKTLTDNICTTVSHNLRNELIFLLICEPTTISKTEIEKINLPSVTVQLNEETSSINDGYIKDPSFITPERIWFSEYITSHFCDYTRPSDDSMLSYEIEYMINGSSSDETNLLSTCTKLALMRASLNASHIVTDSRKFTAVKDLAMKSTVFIPIPGIEQFTELMIISAWSTAEGIIDVRDLLSKKKVPLIKDTSTWTLSLDNIAHLNPNTPSNNSGDSGLDYTGYLQLLLVAQSELALRFRTMDIIQLNICLNYNETFRLSNCIYGVTANFDYSTRNIFLNFNYLTNHKDTTSYNFTQSYHYD